MVSTHSWKATLSSPQPSATQQPTPGFRSPSGFGGMGMGMGAASPAPSSNTSGGSMGYGASSSSASGMGMGMGMGSSATRPFIGGSNQKLPAPMNIRTTTSATPDFESLLANSASLLSSIGRAPGGAAAGPLGGAGGARAPGGSSSSSSAAPATSSNSNVALGDKSLLELSVASRATSAPGGDAASRTRHATSYEAEASAHRLLAREGYGFDSARLGRSARELERMANVTTSSSSSTSGYYGSRTEEEKKDGEYYQYPSLTDGGTIGSAGRESHPLAGLQGASVQHILSAHHEHCVRTALRQAREWTTDQAEKRVEEKLEDDWEVTRREILGRGVVGSRFLLGGAGGGVGGADGSVEGGVASRIPLLEGDSMAIGGAAGTSSAWSNIVPSPQILPGNAEVLIRSHLASIDAYLTSAAQTTNSSPGSNAAMALLASLQEGIKDAAATNSNLSPESMNGYSNALSLGRSIVNCSNSLGVDTTTTNNTKNVNDLAVAAGVMGACNFFANQFASHVKEVVRDAQLAGLHSPNSFAGAGGLTPTARNVCAFASIVVGRDVVEGRGGVWPQLFYCLRCGDMAAANSVLTQFSNATGGSDGTGMIDPVVAMLVTQLATLQQTQETIFGDTTNNNTRPAQPLQSSLLNPSQSIMQTRRMVSDLYERTKTRTQSSPEATMPPFEHYRTACLAMLGGGESISEAATLESSGIVKTVEDYLYGSLWHALHLADAASTSNIGRDGTGGLRRVSKAVDRLKVLVNQWGPSYFEQDADGNGGASAAVAHAAQGGISREKVSPSGGWAYALPLLATQQYATALAYLAEAGGGLGLMQATHVAIAMDAADLAVEDFTVNASETASQQATLLPMLVASYSASLQGVDAVAAFKYLVLLSEKGPKFVKEQVQRLLLEETRQFETLAGKIQPDGTRSNGALDAHFSRKEVDSILADAANHAVRTGRPADAAELLVLSGRFGALFELMNRELASYLNASAGTEDFQKRQFWFNAASQFHAIHLSQGRSYVQNTLSAEGKMSLGNTFQLLMNLIVFFDRCREQQWDGAWTLLDTLSLLPGTESEMDQRVTAFRSLDGCVRQAFHHVVLAAMETLCHLYQTTKQQGGGGVGMYDGNVRGNIDTVNQSLLTFRTSARLLVTFARLLNLPKLGDGETYVRISQLEKNMM